MTTIYDVARVAAVSTATVSRVLRGSDLVHPNTRQRVLAVIETLGFVPDASARGLTRRRKDIIALVGLDRGADEIDIERTSLLFIDHIVHATENVLRGAEYSLLLTFGSPGELFGKRVRSLAGQADGLLIAEEVMEPGELRALAEQIPVVVIAGRREQTAVDVFLSDNIGGMTAVTRHLTQQHQYQRFCFVAGPQHAPDASERRLAFEQAVAASPGSGIAAVIPGDFSEDSGVAAARTLLGRKSLPEAVVCANDQMAIGVLRELQQAGVRVPSEVAVTGFDDVHASRFIDPQLTTVSQPFRDLGSRATHRLLARVDNPALTPAVEVLPTQLVIRASCGCQPQARRLGQVQKALPPEGECDTTSGSSSGNTVTVANPGSQTSTAGTAASLQMSASDSASGQTLTYSATGLPAGLSINSSTGLISGTPTTAGTSTVTVTAKDTTGATGSVSFSWTVNASGGGGGSGGGTSCTTTATSDISADCYSASHGTIDVTSASGDSNPSGVDGNQDAQLANGDYLEYGNVNFGTTGSTQFDARVASGAAGGVSGLVEVVLDSPSNAPVGSFAVGNTGGWSSWETIPANISKVTGTHNVYLEFVSGAGGDPPYVSLHYFNFPAT